MVNTQEILFEFYLKNYIVGIKSIIIYQKNRTKSNRCVISVTMFSCFFQTIVWVGVPPGIQGSVQSKASIRWTIGAILYFPKGRTVDASVSQDLLEANVLEHGSSQVLSGVQGLGKNQRMINCLASPLKWEHTFFGLFRDKIRNIVNWALQKNSRD